MSAEADAERNEKAQQIIDQLVREGQERDAEIARLSAERTERRKAARLARQHHRAARKEFVRNAVKGVDGALYRAVGGEEGTLVYRFLQALLYVLAPLVIVTIAVTVWMNH